MSALPRTLPLAPYRDRVDAYLRDLPIPYTSLAGTIISSHLGRERDLLRASLVLWACAACGGDAEQALPTAAAVELFHRSEGLRDELLAGDPAWGLGQCLNAGDALNAIAYKALVVGDSAPQRRLRSSMIVTRAFVEGIERRNGAILWAGLEAGAVLAGAPDRLARRLRRAGRLLAAAGSGENARAYAEKAVLALEGSGLDSVYLAGFAEAARYVASEAA
jgi:geranylgeranyl pyrophosphate synthase